jgi:hypothetical protein
MLPIRDTIRSYTFPIITWLLIGINILVFLFELSLTEPMLNQLIMTFGVVPARLHLDNPAALLSDPMALIPLFTHMFLHGGWFHIISNLWILYIFGDNVEDRMGSGLSSFTCCGLAAAFAQAFTAPDSQIHPSGPAAQSRGGGGYCHSFPKRGDHPDPTIFIPGIPRSRGLLPWFWFSCSFFQAFARKQRQPAEWPGGRTLEEFFGVLIYRLFTLPAPPIPPYPDEYWPW